MIKVTDRFYINSTTNCYTLQERTTVQDEKSKNYGKEVYKDLGYYTSIENCLQGIFKVATREFINQEQENSMEELIKQVKKQIDFLKNLKLDF